MTGSLASVHPELIPEWSEKNLPLTPDKITFGSNKRVWWKLPFKTTETEAEYADRVKAVFKSVHIFIYSDVEADVSVIRAKFNEWRKRL